jgi:hypothetical protein
MMACDDFVAVVALLGSDSQSMISGLVADLWERKEAVDLMLMYSEFVLLYQEALRNPSP